VKFGAGASAFGGATYDPTSHYRAAAVFDFHVQQGLTPERLRTINQRQVMLLKSSFEALDVKEALAHVVGVPDERRGGFLAVRSPHAADLSRRLRERGVWTDARGDILRLGPAPYLDDAQLRDGVAAVGDALRQVASPSSSPD
jgi:kynureninase